jgi:DHA1 family tetracycline resistance protein-like MFS transporter
MQVILLAIFLDLVSYGILVPVIPQLFANPASEYYLLDPGTPISLGYILLGFLIAGFPIFQFFSTPILGELSDIYGRKKIMALSLLGSVGSFACFAYGVMTLNIYIIFASRFVGGILGGNLAVAQAAIADITKPEERTRNFGLIGAAYGVGFILGPVIGAVLSNSNYSEWLNLSTPFWFAAGLSLVTALLVYRYMDETNTNIKERVKISWLKGVLNVVNAYAIKETRPILTTNFLFQAGVTFFATFFSVFLIAKFNMNQVGIGYYIGYVGIWVVITQAVFLRVVASKFSDVSLLRIFLLLGSGAVFSFFLPNTVAGLLIAGALFAIMNAVNMAALPGLISRMTPANRQGEMLGINASVQALAQAIPPILSGFIAANIAPVAPVYISGGVIGLAWIVFILFVKRK